MSMSDLRLTRPGYPGGGDWRPAFLAMLRNSANIRLSCAEAGISRTIAYQHRDADAQFARDWDDALEDACDLVEAKARQLALEGSERMIELILRAHRRRVYGERLDVTIAVQRAAERLAAEQGVPLDDVLAEIDVMFNPVRSER